MFRPIAMILLTLASLAGTLADASYRVDRHSCVRVDARIDQVQRQMTGGYSIEEGEYLRDDLRNLKKQRAACRKQNYPTSK